MRTTSIFKNVCSLIIAAMFTACNGTSIEGTWVEPIPGMSNLVQGMKLEAGGKASSVNMATLLYETWKKEGDKLILTGQSIGNLQTFAFTDTCLIQKLTADSLILKKGDLLLKYAKTEKEFATNTIPAAKLTPAQKPFLVKGELVIGHEVCSFIPAGDTTDYWISDETDKLIEQYDEVTKGTKNGTPVYAELEVIDAGKAEDGFAADYTSVYEVVKIVKIEKIKK